MNLYELTAQAQHDVNIYRSPDLSEWIAAIDPVLGAAGETVIGSDKVESIELHAHTLRIRTSYTVRCCAQTNDMEIPTSLLIAENPVKEATRYYLDKSLRESKAKLHAAEQELQRWTDLTATIEAEIEALNKDRA